MKTVDQHNRIEQGDCVKLLAALPPNTADLAFADPPFNIGYDYDVYEDKKTERDYLSWCREWITGLHRALKPAGTFWLAIGDEYAAELKIISQEVGFTCRSWVIWYYTFGVNCSQKFSRSHAHLFYFVKDAKRFTFRAEELENRVPSARQLVYADGRANPRGRLPDDTWVLRPQDLADCFTSAEDTWYFPRVAGTFKERAGFHGCQMPEQLLGRIVRLCSHEGDLVLDPFSGSATTLVVSNKLGRRYLGFELSEEYAKRGRDRLAASAVGDPLDGAAEPTMSAPATPRSSKKRGRTARSAQPAAAALPATTSAVDALSATQRRLFERGLLEAYTGAYEGYSLDRVVADPDLNSRFADTCRHLGLPGDARSWNLSLFRLRKAGALAHLATPHRTELRWADCEPFLFASEIAWRHMIDAGSDSLDNILCDPALAAEFDSVAARWAPGYRPLEYRWGALKLRKKAKTARARAKLMALASLGRAVPLERAAALPATPGVYVILGEGKRHLYAGETGDLQNRIRYFAEEALTPWRELSERLSAKVFRTDPTCEVRLGYQHQLVERHKPQLNLLAAGSHE